MKFNIGTYSFGMDNNLSLKEMFAKAKEIGYDGVEILERDIDAFPAEDIKKWADEAGIEIVSIHAQFEGAEERIPKFASLGGKTYIIPSYNFANKEEALHLAAKLNALAEIAKPYNVKVGYHNHTSEFFVDEGKPILEYVIENTDPEAVFFQIDVGWATAADCDVPAFIRKYSGRIRAIHVKENNASLGTGEPRHEGAPRPKMQIGPDGKPILTEEMKARFAAMQERNKVQVPLGDPTSRISWFEVKKALDEQGLDEVFWTVEREYDYKPGRINCITEDAAWLRANIK